MSPVLVVAPLSQAGRQARIYRHVSDQQFPGTAMHSDVLSDATFCYCRPHRTWPPAAWASNHRAGGHASAYRMRVIASISCAIGSMALTNSAMSCLVSGDRRRRCFGTVRPVAFLTGVFPPGAGLPIRHVLRVGHPRNSVLAFA